MSPSPDSIGHPDASENRKSPLKKALEPVNKLLFGGIALGSAVLFEDMAFDFQNVLRTFAASPRDHTTVLTDDTRSLFHNVIDSEVRLAVALFPVMYKDPHALEMVRKAFRQHRIGSQLAASTIMNHPAFKDRPWGPPLTKEAVEAIEPDMLARIFDKSREVPGVQDRMAQTVKEMDSLAFLEKYESLKELPGATQKYALAMRLSSPTRVAERFEFFKNAPSANDDFLKLLPKIDIVTARTLVENYKSILPAETLEKARSIAKGPEVALFVEAAATVLSPHGVAEHLGHLRIPNFASNLDLGTLAPYVSRASPEFWKEMEKRLTKADGFRRVKSAKQNLEFLRKESMAHEGANPLELAQLAQLVLAEGFYSGRKDAKFEKALGRVLDGMRSYENVPIFNRRIVIIAGAEKTKAGTPRFAQPELVDAAKEAQKQAGYRVREDSVVFITPESDSKEHQEAARKRVLTELRSTREPTLFIFNGHGGEDVFTFGNEQSMSFISSRDIAEALLHSDTVRRVAKSTKEPSHSVLFASCSSGAMAAELAHRYRVGARRGIIGLSSSEGTEKSYSELENPLGANFFTTFFKAGTYGNLIRQSRDILHNEPSSGLTIIVPTAPTAPGSFIRVSGMDPSALSSVG